MCLAAHFLIALFLFFRDLIFYHISKESWMKRKCLTLFIAWKFLTVKNK